MDHPWAVGSTLDLREKTLPPALVGKNLAIGTEGERNPGSKTGKASLSQC